MSKDFITNQILSDTAQAIRHCENSVGGIAPVNYAERIRALDKLIPQPDALNFYMPNGGTIGLNKTGSPTVVELEYSLDRGTTWTVWQEDANGNRSLVLNAGQRMYVRNTSDTNVRFSISEDDYYTFTFTANTYANGNINSLLCKNPDNAIISEYCFCRLFRIAIFLLKAPDFPSTTLQSNCYYSALISSGIEESPILPASIVPTNAYRQLFQSAKNLSKITTYMTDISAYKSIYYWTTSVSKTGDFYCPAELTIPIGFSGIPSGWTRHDI